MASLSPQELANLPIAFRAAAARLQFLRAQAKLAGVLTPDVKREIAQARTHRDRVRREITARATGQTYIERRKATRDYRREVIQRRERKTAIREGRAEPAPLRGFEAQKVAAWSRKYDWLEADTRNITNERERFRIMRRVVDTWEKGKAPTKRLQTDYQSMTGHRWPWRDWRKAYRSSTTLTYGR